MSGALWGLINLTVGLFCGWMVSAMIIMGSIADERAYAQRMWEMLYRIVAWDRETNFRKRLDLEEGLFEECRELLRDK